MTDIDPSRVVVVTAGLRAPSSTRLLADELADAVVEEFASAGRSAEVRIVEVREHAHAIADALLTGFAAGALAEDQRALAEADAVVVVTPTFSGSYSGLFKSFFDVLELGALDQTPVLLAATGGTERHSLMLEHALRPLFTYLKAVPVPTAIYAATADFGGPGTASLSARVRRGAAELARAVSGSTSRPTRSAVAADSLAFTPFEELLPR
ncbi:CE1759 family FMN reductase [Nocardioides sp. R-C-SC26]|uniref:CE1759 family FMN reductase n=1 Tax=Nocardioides sp. R-C-SC26 TaxID=2870414 RepID=UPI001E5456B5|nr:CE1759 family FMN reductase [Nocardioides sp. R-C-SC26]